MGERRRVVLRQRARHDVEAAVDWYRDEAGEDTAPGVRGRARGRAGTRRALPPSSGSTRCSVELGIPALRCWQVERYPYLVFNVERDDHIDVWRVLKAIVTSPAWMRDPDEPQKGDDADDSPSLRGQPIREAR